MDQKNRTRKSRYENKGTPYKIVNEEVLRTDGKYIIETEGKGNTLEISVGGNSANDYTIPKGIIMKAVKEAELKDEEIQKIYKTIPKPVTEIYQPLPSEIVEELMTIDEGRGHNLTPKKYNIKPIVDVLEAVIRIQKRKLVNG